MNKNMLNQFLLEYILDIECFFVKRGIVVTTKDHRNGRIEYPYISIQKHKN